VVAAGGNVKASIRKHDGQWLLTRPPYGFASDPEVTIHASWKAARLALLGDAPASAASSVERGAYTLMPLNQSRWPRRGTIRLETT
jgi:hypothetical protein